MPESMEKKQELSMKKNHKPFKPQFHEKLAWEKGKFVCGIDEVGRGCLAGPLVVAAVVLPCNTRYPLLKDSKVLLEKDRQKAHAWIMSHAFSSIVFIHNHDIDRLNIYQATLLGMRKAVRLLIALHPQLASTLEALLVDAMPLRFASHETSSPLPVHFFNHGETLSKSIAAASILAKVTRDRFMEKINPSFPWYSFKNHKGYGTVAHQNELLTTTRSLIHRTSFIQKIQEKHSMEKNQRCLFEEKEDEITL